MKKKNILLICKESYSFPFYFLAKKLLEENNNVACYFFNPIETGYEKCMMNENTFFAHKGMGNLKVYDNIDMLELFNNNLNNPPIDWGFLDFVEKNFTKDKCLSLQMLTTQFFSRVFHDRFFFNEVTYEQQLYWLELNYKRVIEIFDEYTPDVIWDLDNAELSRSIIAEISQSRNIPYILIDHPRYEMFKIPTFSTVWKNNYFNSVFNKKKELDVNSLKTEYEYVENFRKQDKIMSNVFKNHITSSYERTPIDKSIKSIIGKILYLVNISFKGKNISLRKKNKILFPSSLVFLWYFVKVEFKRWYLLGSNKYFSNPIIGERYVYMPLHVIPESSTNVSGPFYINELFTIEQISKSLPVGCYLYVKEHQAMLGERAVDFYRKANKIPNVKMVNINYYKDPKPWIQNSIGVITVTGSSSYEAALLGKKSIVFGDVAFNVIDGITRAKSFEELPRLIANFGMIDNIHSCAAYLATVKSLGMELDLKYLANEGEQILIGKKMMSDKYISEIDKLNDFFEKSMEQIIRN
tara:strand:- start:9773 stop:11344 length:1572 start_codon:yes stop_codon:yes gene_type:complete